MNFLLYPYRISLMKNHTIMLYSLITYSSADQILQPVIRNRLIERIFITIYLIIRIILKRKQAPQFSKTKVQFQELRQSNVDLFVDHLVSGFSKRLKNHAVYSTSTTVSTKFIKG